MEFEKFLKIEQYGKLRVSITQKIHGSNAQILIQENGDILAGSRGRWLNLDHDNYGFCRFVDSYKNEIVEKLGPGRHFGEWAGPGINSGEGLTEKTFVLFDWWKFPEDRSLPPQCRVVPLLYNGKMSTDEIDCTFNDLRESGSRLVPGFMRPEGIVIDVGGTRFKRVFEQEETQWRRAEPKLKAEDYDAEFLMQPVRLEKLLSRDEQYARDYPQNLPQLVQAYIQDLVDEDQIPVDVLNNKKHKKCITNQAFLFVKHLMVQYDL